MLEDMAQRERGFPVRRSPGDHMPVDLYKRAYCPRGHGLKVAAGGTQELAGENEVRSGS